MRAYAGIGCHYMVQWMDRSTDGFTQMGGEGANWIGEAPFSKRGHVFQNLGDGTYNHSGILALRWSVDTKTNVTYKILFNDAVAMTGGQPHEGKLTVDMIARQVREEGVERIALVTDEPHKYPMEIRWPAGMTIHHRNELDAVQRGLAEIPGVTVMIYDQTCASEKRRRRKRGEFPDPDKRVIINDLRGLRRLLRAIQLRCRAAGRDGIRPQAPDRSVELQQGFFLRERLLPVVRDGARSQDQEGHA
jgi:indolepyruvate ferredoxin oxidoreductase